MDVLKKFFPFSFSVKKDDIVSLIINILIHLGAGAVLGWIFGLLAHIPLVGFIFGLVGGLVGLYLFVGIVIMVLDYFNVLK